MIANNNISVCSARNQKARQHRWLYSICFATFLFVTVLGRMMPWQWRVGQQDPAGRKSIVQEAREQAGMFVGFMFVNY